MVKRYVLLKNGVRESTRAGYKTVTNFLEKDSFGKRKITEIRLSDAKEWLIKLQSEQKKSYSSVHTIRGVLRPAFRMAVEDDLIKKDPFDFQLSTVVVNDSVTKEAITHKQKRDFLPSKTEYWYEKNLQWFKATPYKATNKITQVKLNV